MTLGGTMENSTTIPVPSKVKIQATTYIWVESMERWGDEVKS